MARARRRIGVRVRVRVSVKVKVKVRIRVRVRVRAVVPSLNTSLAQFRADTDTYNPPSSDMPMPSRQF